MIEEKESKEVSDEADKTETAEDSNKSVCWLDITEKFRAQCQQLDLGELVHETSFSLFEAMSAIEMMDPKMDAGMLCNQTQRRILNFEQSIEEGSVRVKDVEYTELISIIDDSFASLVTWLEGHSLAQTVFTNLYLHNPQLIENPVLKAFSIGILKIVEHVHEKISMSYVFEEEDFQPLTYGFKLGGEPDQKAVTLLKTAEDQLSKSLKVLKSKEEELENNEVQLVSAVLTRIRFTKLFVSALAFLVKPPPADPEKNLLSAIDLLDAISNTINLGVVPVPCESDPHDYPSIMGFEPLVNQRLLPPTFPRYTQIKSREETYIYLQDLLKRIAAIFNITRLTGLHAWLEFFSEFSKKSPCVLSRSCLQLLPSQNLFTSRTLHEPIRDAIRSFIAPPALSSRASVSSDIASQIQEFLVCAARPIGHMFEILGHNRARQRDRWGHLLEELSGLQDDADKLDSALHKPSRPDCPTQQPACFGIWVLYHTLRTMLRYTMAGFELELYAVHEYHYVFWYLYEGIYGWLISTLMRASQFLLGQDSDNSQKSKGSKKNRKKKKSCPYQNELTLAHAEQSLCGAYYKAVVGFTIENKLKMPKFDFDSEEVRYNHRFAPFGSVSTPPPIHYTEFKEMTDLSRFMSSPNAMQFYKSASKCFQEARSYLEKLQNPSQEVQNLVKVCKTNFVVMNLLLGGHKKDSKDSPDFDFSIHSYFPLIKL